MRDRFTAAAGLVAAVLYLLAPPLGTDLAAQTARAGFAARHGAAVWDLGWYAGTSPYGYSLLTPWPMAWLGAGHDGPRRLGALALVASAVLLAVLLRRTGARRPLLAGLLGVLGLAGNLVSGRVTFAVGVAFGLAALVWLTLRVWWPLAAAFALLASAASPVAGLFVGLAGAALLAGRRWGPGLVVGAAAAVPIAVTTVLFGAGGTMNISALDAARAIGASLAVAALVPVRVVRAGALLSAGGVLAASVFPTPVGLNAVRLAAIFTLPVLAGYAVLHLPRIAAPASVAALLVVAGLVQPPVSVTDLRNAGDPAAAESWAEPLRAELRRRAPAGRVEVVPTENYWEAAWIPEAAPLARGWLRQADIARNPLFFDGRLDADRYRAWLDTNGVTLVALPSATPSWVGRREAELIRGGLPYLTEVWRHPDWTLYAVTGAPGLVPGGAVHASTERALTVDVTAAGDHLVRVRWSRWLTVSGPLGPVGPVGIAGDRAVVLPGGCLTPAADGWTTLRVDRGGRYRISSGFAGSRC